MDCLRVPPHYVHDAEQLDRLLTLLRSPAHLVEEVVFFTSQYHCPQPVAALEREADAYRSAIALFKQHGYRAGLNHLATIGHHEENLDLAVGPELRRSVGLDGRACQGSLCPTDPAVFDYVADTYRVLAGFKPNIIWVDDDMRLGGHMPTGGCCVCDACLAIFSTKAGQPLTREAFIAQFDHPDPAARTAFRRQWLEHNGQVISNLLGIVERTTHAADPAIELGLMTGDRIWEGYDFSAWATALRGPSPIVRWRPGGGFYDDNRPAILLEKLHSIGRQNSQLPDFVRISQSELENFPHQPLRKSMAMNVIESSGYLFAGCTGTAFNILGTEEVGTYGPLIDHLIKAQPFATRLKSLLVGAKPTGVWVGWDPKQLAGGRAGHTRTLCDDIDIDMVLPNSLGVMGLPICYAPEDAQMVALSGRMPYALGEERMRQILSTGALLDATAVQTLAEMGLDHLAGVRVGNRYDRDTVERFNDHPLNGGGHRNGAHRDCRQCFPEWFQPAYALEPISPKVETLARISDYQGIDRGASFTAFTNNLGGRVAVMSYFPWTMNLGADRQRQTVNVCDWLSHGRLPVLVDGPIRIHTLVNRLADERLIVGLVNISMDTHHDVGILIRTPHTQCQMLSPDGTLQSVAATRTPDGLSVVLSALPTGSITILAVGPVASFNSQT